MSAGGTHVLASPDLFVDNDVFLLRRDRYPGIAAVGGMVWLRRGPPAEAKRAAMSEAVNTVSRAIPSLRWALLGAHGAPQFDNAVSRHRRLWRSLEADGLTVPRGVRTEEVGAAVRDGIKWRGAIALHPDDLSSAVALALTGLGLLVAAPSELIERVGELVARGWEEWSMLGPPPAVLEWVQPQGIVFWPVGGFDDPESGVVGFSSRDVGFTRP